MKILIVEDEFNLADVIASRLKKEKYVVDICGNGEDGLYQALYGCYDLILLDVMLPGVDGFDILKRVREEKINVKVIMLTAKDMLEDKLSGFEKGANDYVTKPFQMEELVARVRAQLRSDNQYIINDDIEVGDLILDRKNSNLRCTSTKETIEVRCKEFLLLEYFMCNPIQIISKDQIYDKVWGMDQQIESNNLEAYVSFLRKKIKIIGSKASIKAIRGMGYKLEVCDEKTKK